MVNAQHGADGIPPLDAATVEAWAAEAESDTGYTGAHLGPAVAERPVSRAVAEHLATLRLRYAQAAALVLLAAGVCMALATRWAPVSGPGVTLLIMSVPASIAGLTWAYRAGEGLPEFYARQRRLTLLVCGVEVLILVALVLMLLLSPDTYLPG